MAHLLLNIALACDIGPRLGEAEDLVMAIELDAASAVLNKAETELSCGESSPEQLARFWMLTAGVALSEGDDDGVQEALVAAKAADAMFWMPALGPDLKERWRTARPSETLGRLVVLDLPTGYALRVDGAVVTETPLELPAGLHVVQARGGEHGWGRVINVQATSDSSISTDLPALPKAPEPAPEPVLPEPQPELKPKTGVQVGGYAALGVAIAVGSGVDVDPHEEPGIKVGPMLEAGLRVAVAPVVLRVGVGADLPLTGRYVFLDGEGTPKQLWVAPAVLVSVGFPIGPLELGVQGGVQLPSRVPLRVYGAVGLTDRIGIELRGGVTPVGSRRIDASGGTTTSTTTSSIKVEGGGSVLATVRI